MRKTFAAVGMILAAALASSGQTSSSTQAAPAKSSTAAKPATTVAAKPTAVIDTTAGKMTCTLFPDKAPIGVKNFVDLATGKKDWKNPVGTMKHGVPLYDGTIFHRVIPEFMIQGGDPAGTGSGPDPVPQFKNEVSSDLLFDQPGRLAYANAGPNTNSSQFFITEVATPHLNGGYTIFGQCDEATVALVKQISHMATDPRNDRPFRPVKIVHITILHGGAAARTRAAAVKKPAAKPPATN
ncbi:MAG TPA: peptidylprolyl isomerase [Terriglobales bacterium]|nr:peptidylprolyl isomerase [Terriglobales bacterium]